MEMELDHIRPISALPHGEPEVPEYCEEVACRGARVTCRRRHDDSDCGLVYGCAAPRSFECADEHECSRKFKCFEYQID
jgi:hypothetical protein